MATDKINRRYRLWIRSRQGHTDELTDGTFDELSGDYDFDSMDEVEKIQNLEVGEEYDDGYGLWTRFPDDADKLPVSAEMQMNLRHFASDRDLCTGDVRDVIVTFMRTIESSRTADVVLRRECNNDPEKLKEVNEILAGILEAVMFDIANKAG